CDWRWVKCQPYSLAAYACCLREPSRWAFVLNSGNWRERSLICYPEVCYGHSECKTLSAILPDLQREFHSYGRSAEGCRCGRVSERRRGSPRPQSLSRSEAATLQGSRRSAEAEESQVIFYFSRFINPRFSIKKTRGLVVCVWLSKPRKIGRAHV